MKIAGQEFPKWAMIALFVTGSFMVLWLMVLIIGSPKSFGWAYRLEVNSWLLFFTSFGVLVNVFTLIFLGLTFFNQQKHHDEMMVESACFSMLSTYTTIAGNSFVGQKIEVLKRDLKYLRPLKFNEFEKMNYNDPRWDERTRITLSAGRAFFGDFYRFLRGGSYVWKHKLGVSTHEELFKRLYEEQFNRAEFWPICDTLFSNFIAVLVYYDNKRPRNLDLYLSLLNASITMEEMAILYYLGHAKFNNGLNVTQQKVVKSFFEKYPIDERVPNAILLSEEPLEWGSYRPS